MRLRRFYLLLAALLTAPIACLAQASAMSDWEKAAGGKATFEVASIKVTTPGASTRPNIPLDDMDGFAPTGGVFSADASLEEYLEFAYKVYLAPEQRTALLAGMPKWVTTQRFAIRARGAGDPSKDQYRLMMQSLLAARFKMTVHFEKQDMPVFALVLAKPGKLGPFLRATADGPPCGTAGNVADAMPSPAKDIAGGWSSGWPYGCNAMGIYPRPNRLLLWGLRSCTMACIGTRLANMPPKDLGRPVVDETGLSGKFDLALEWEYGPPPSYTPPLNAADSGAPAAEVRGPTLQEALEAQLGLKMKATHALVDTLIVDHVEMPSEN